MFKIIFCAGAIMETGAPRGKTRMPYTPEHKRETRHKILESARRLFNKKGFSEVSIDEVMGTAGLTKHPRTSR
jgi:AcrR family transcriptional regulator